MAKKENGFLKCTNEAGQSMSLVALGLKVGITVAPSPLMKERMSNSKDKSQVLNPEDCNREAESGLKEMGLIVML